jgi:glucosamine-6-phosphate deaminase
LEIEIFETKREAGAAAALRASDLISSAIETRGQAFLIAATGASQTEFLEGLGRSDIDWSRTTFFHLDEYIGLAKGHPASFRRYLQERVVERLHPGTFRFVDGSSMDPRAECERLGELISACQIDVAFVGIGENGHLAFNDPPADFETADPYIVVELDEACRRQQVGEGWFRTIEEVPQSAISMSVGQILKSSTILCIAPEARKANAVHDAVAGPVTPLVPASILQRHPSTYLYLDRDSASRLREGHS